MSSFFMAHLTLADSARVGRGTVGENTGIAKGHFVTQLLPEPVRRETKPDCFTPSMRNLPCSLKERAAVAVSALNLLAAAICVGLSLHS